MFYLFAVLPPSGFLLMFTALNFIIVNTQVMISENVIVRMADRFTTYAEKYITLAGVESKEEVLDLFDKMHTLFPHWVIATCPVMHPEIKYASKNCQYIFDTDRRDLMNNNGGSYFKQVHDADQDDLLRCFEYVHDFLEATPPEFHHQYRCIFHYRFTKSNGQHIHVHDEKAVLNLKSSGNLYYTLFSDITTEKSFSGVSVALFKQETYLKKIATHKPSTERKALSKREGELVTLFKQGLSTKEIAWYLKISHNTVRNIKSKMFEKYNVNNTIELLNMTA
jgi:DNA-binding CsgD family transcriptional regulator